MSKALLITLNILLALLLAFQVACTAVAESEDPIDTACENLLECLTAEGVREHLVAFQEIADASGGTRAAGTPGYAASAAYVRETLLAAGYEPELHEFLITYMPPDLLRQTAPDERVLQTGRIIGTGSGKVEGPVIPVDLALGTMPWPADPSTSTSGCEMADFDALDFSGPNDIALLQGGACISSSKVLNAEAAGAEAAIILIKDDFNIREGLPVDNVSKKLDSSPSNVTIPLVGVSLKEGAALSQDGTEALLEVGEVVQLKEYSVLAELRGSGDGKVIMAGAHLDSAPQGPGISDNGSGSAAILETAVLMSALEPYNTVRFAWWGAEELGIVGSGAYVSGLSQEERDEIALYLNFDMIASPNYVNYIYHTSRSEGLAAGQERQGSAAIEKTFESFFEEQGEPYEIFSPPRHSDYLSFEKTGIPVGALLTYGGEGFKTKAQAAKFGGSAGVAHDPCYHQSCDTIDNIDMHALEVNSDAAAFTIFQYAMNADEVDIQ